MNKLIYNFRKSVSLFLLGIALRINSHNLCAIILRFNIRKLKRIKYNKKNLKKILIFSKSGGNEDIKDLSKITKIIILSFIGYPGVF